MRLFQRMQPTRPNLVVSAETAAKGVSAGSGASMMDGWRLCRSVRGTGEVPVKVVRLVFVIVSLESNQLSTVAWVLIGAQRREVYAWRDARDLMGGGGFVC